MRRKTFLQSLATFGALAIAPVAATARHLFTSREKGFKVDAGKSRVKTISLFEGDTFFTKVSSKDTNGDLYVFESIRSKEGGPPLHFHHEQDEWWYVLQGEFLFKVGDETFTAKQGDSVFGPRMIPHTFAKVGDGEAKLIMMFQPAGKMEEYFQAVSEGVLVKMSDQERAALRKKSGFEVVGPALTHLKQ